MLIKRLKTFPFKEWYAMRVIFKEKAVEEIIINYELIGDK